MEAPPINLWPTIRNIQMNTERLKMFQFTSRFPFLKVRQNLQRDIGHCSALFISFERPLLQIAFANWYLWQSPSRFGTFALFALVGQIIFCAIGSCIAIGMWFIDHHLMTLPEFYTSSSPACFEFTRHPRIPHVPNNQDSGKPMWNIKLSNIFREHHFNSHLWQMMKVIKFSL